MVERAIEPTGKVQMGRLIVVRATWDRDAGVWVAVSSDLPGLITEAASLDELDRKLPGLIQDLLEDGDNNEDIDIPIEIVASRSSRVRVRPRAA